MTYNQQYVDMDYINIDEKYQDVPNIAKWKALVTEYGIDLEDANLFVNYPDIYLYKTKYRILNPIADKLKVFDKSQDESIIPSEVIIDDGHNSTIVKIAYKETSPFLLQRDNCNNVILIEKNTSKVIPLKISLIKRHLYQEQRIPKSICSEEPKLKEFIEMVGLDRLSILTFDGCWNWNTNQACRFCDLNPKRESFVSYKPTLNTLANYNSDIDLWWNSYKEDYLKCIKYTFDYILKKENIYPHQHLLIMSGNLPKPEKVWDISIEIIKTLNEINNISNLDNYLNVCPHPNLEYLKKVKQLGVKQVQYNLEVIGKDCFKNMCPGKCDYNLFFNKLCEAVSIMGFGKVRSNFVLGIQPIDELLKGIYELAKIGVVADYSIFQPKRGTPLEKHPSPSMETIINFTKELAKIYKKFGFSSIYCGLSSRSSIINEFLCAKNTTRS